MNKFFAQRAFTLIELMVSVAIFTVIMVIALGALLSVSNADRKAETIKTVMNNLNFAVEEMSRSIRTGYYYDCTPTLPISDLPTPSNCASGYHVLAYRSAEGIPGQGDSPITNATVVFCRGNGSACDPSGSSILRSTDGGTTYVPITSSEIIISNLAFYVKGACSQSSVGGCAGGSAADSLQPQVTMALSGYINIGATGSTTFNIQTSVTQRIYDI
jgi:prepilin-type N-terminal cleavage/methylation domain-containing protein